MRSAQADIPSFVRIKPGALGRLGVYAARHRRSRPVLLASAGLPAAILATLLMLNGVAMAICGSSRPASGAEHLISHALGQLSARPRYHGLQVGVATYVTSRLHGGVHTETISRLFQVTGFWARIRQDPFSAQEWSEAVRVASQTRPERYTVLNRRDRLDEVELIVASDPNLAGCFV